MGSAYRSLVHTSSMGAVPKEGYEGKQYGTFCYTDLNSHFMSYA